MNSKLLGRCFFQHRFGTNNMKFGFRNVETHSCLPLAISEDFPNLNLLHLNSILPKHSATAVIFLLSANSCAYMVLFYSDM